MGERKPIFRRVVLHYNEIDLETAVKVTDTTEQMVIK